MHKLFRHSFYLLLVFAVFAACKPHARITKTETTVIPIDSTTVINEDTSALRIITPFKEKMDAQMNGVLVYSDMALIKSMPEGLLNNFVADVVLKVANENYMPEDNHKVDMCLLNNGGLRSSLPKGVITMGKVYELMPFENGMVVVTLSGENANKMFSYIAKQGGMPISGFVMGIKDTSAVDVTINGNPFDITKQYKVVTSDYLSNGGDKMNFFKSPLQTEDLGIKVRDAIIDFMKKENQKGNTINAKLDNRVHYEK